MSKYLEEADDVQFSEPILAQKGVRCGISFVEKTVWTVKEKEKWSEEQHEAMQGLIGQTADAVKLTVTISDDSVRTEHEDAKPRLTIEDQFNIEAFPYPDKNTGKVKKLGRQKLFQVEEAFGFEPVFKVGDETVEAHVTKTGRKVAPKLEGVKRVVNPDFFGAYFTAEGEPVTDNWIGKEVYADISVRRSDQFGDKNEVQRYVKAPEV